MTTRTIRSITAGLVLLLLVVGLPILLVLWGRSPLAGDGSTWEQIRAMPTEPVSDHVAFGLMTIAAWIAWAAFTAHVVVEFVAACGVATRWRLPTFGPIQFGARQLVSALTMTIILTGAGQRAGAVPALAAATADVEARELLPAPTSPVNIEAGSPVQPYGTVTDTESLAPASVQRAEAGTAPDDADTGRPVVTVAPGDNPWALAERHLGDGLRWREIWDLNRGLSQPDGRAWITEDLIHPGWLFHMPDDATGLSYHSGRDSDTAQDEPELPPEADDEPEPPPEPSDTDEPAITPPSDHSDADGPELDEGASDPSVDQTNDPEEASTDKASSDVPTTPEESASAGQDGQEATTTAQENDPPSSDDSREEQEDASDTAGSNDTSEDQANSSTPTAPFLGIAGVLIAVGVTRLLRRNRTRRAAGQPVGTAPSPSPQVSAGREALERADEDGAERLETALAHLARSLRPRPGAEGPHPRVVQVHDGRVDVLLGRPDPKPPRPWRPEASGLIWVLDAYQPLSSLDSASPAPALVTIGVGDDQADILVDLEAHGVVALVGHEPACQDLARSMLVELATRCQDVNAQTTIVGDVLGETPTHFDGVATAASWSDIDTSPIDSSIRLLDTGNWPHTFAARASGRVPDSWAPSVWITSDNDDPAYNEVLETISGRPGAGSALVVVGHDPNCGLRIHLDDEGQFQIPDLGLTGAVQAIASDVADDLAVLLQEPISADGEAEDNLPDHAGDIEWGDDFSDDEANEARGVEPADLAGEEEIGERHTTRGDSDGVPATPLAEGRASPPQEGGGHGHGREADTDIYQDPPYNVMVRLCGTITIDGARTPLGHRDTAVATYIALHGRSVSPDEILEAIWSGEVTRKRVANVVSTIRSAVGNAITWTSDHRLIAGPDLTTDVALIDKRLAYAEHLPVEDKALVLRDGLDLITGRVCTWPRAGQRSWVWIEYAHWIPQIEAVVGKLASQAARTFLELGDGEGAVFAARRGIEGLGRREELAVLLIRAHEMLGDHDSARNAARDYERWLDSLGVDEHSEELLALLERYAPAKRTLA